MPPANQRTALVLAAVNRWNKTHPGQQIDPQAELQVAGVEGLSGGIGDGGHAFGPNQLNDAGGVLTGKLNGLSPQQKNAWAWSPQGIDYALSGVARAAGNERGPRAVNDIVRRFERPANPDREVASALGGSSPAAGLLSAPSPVAPAAGNPRAFASSLLAAISPTGQLSNDGLLQAIQSRGSVPGSPRTTPVSPGSGGIAELLREGVGGPTHSTGPHIHAAFTDPNLELAAIQKATQLGLHIGENPYVGDAVDPVHAKNSYHDRTFPGLFNGRKLGGAIDVSGPQQNAFYAWLAGRR